MHRMSLLSGQVVKGTHSTPAPLHVAQSQWGESAVANRQGIGPRLGDGVDGPAAPRD